MGECVLVSYKTAPAALSPPRCLADRISARGIPQPRSVGTLGKDMAIPVQELNVFVDATAKTMRYAHRNPTQAEHRGRPKKYFRHFFFNA